MRMNLDSQQYVFGGKKACRVRMQKIASHAASRRPKPPPNVVREIFYVISLGLYSHAGYILVEAAPLEYFYQLLEQGKISVVVGGDEEDDRRQENRRENIN